MKSKISKYAAILILILNTSCNKYLNVNNYIPSVKFSGVTIKKIEPEISITPVVFKAKLNLDLKFRFNNPYDIPLIVPDHDFKFKIAAREITELSKNQAGFTIPPKSIIVEHYTLQLDLDPQGYFKDFMGKDNPYTFESAFYINVNDYVQDNLMRKAIKLVTEEESVKIPFEFEDTLRLPLPPQISSISTDPSYVDFLGSNNRIDLSAMSPFVDFMLGTKIKVYNPISFKTEDVNAAQFLVKQLSLVDNTAGQKWNDFIDKWNSIKSNLVVEYPGPNTTGYKIYIPVSIYNPNEFPIEAGFFTATAKYDESYNSYILELKSQDNDNVIASKSSKRLYLTWQTNFFQGNIMQVFGGGSYLPHNPALQGKMGIDIGYGMMEIPYNFAIPFKFGN